MTEVLQMLISAQDDLAWYEANLNQLKGQYDGKFVAFKNKEVLDSDSILDNLLERLKRSGVDISTVFVKFVSRVKAIL